MSWERVTAINGRGKLLKGPHGENGRCVFAPPGVMLRTAVDNEPPSRDGWRIGRWLPDADGELLIDQHDPVEYEYVRLADVVRELDERAPEFLSWVAKLVERDIRRLHGRRFALDHCGRFVFRENVVPPRDAWLGAIAEAEAAFAGTSRVPPGHFTQFRTVPPPSDVRRLPSELRTSPPCD